MGRLNEAEALFIKCWEYHRENTTLILSERTTNERNTAEKLKPYDRIHEILPIVTSTDHVMKELICNPDHYPNALCAMNNLASVYVKQGKWELAEYFYMDCLKSRTTILGK
jgi:hypothetical protein